MSFWVISSLCISVQNMGIQINYLNPYDDVSMFDVRCRRNGNQIYSESLFMIKLQLLLCLYLSMFLFVFFGLRTGQYDQIMRWWSSNLGQGLLQY